MSTSLLTATAAVGLIAVTIPALIASHSKQLTVYNKLNFKTTQKIINLINYLESIAFPATQPLVQQC